MQINNATTAFVKRISGAFAPEAVVRILLFPGEAKPNGLANAGFQQAEIAIVSIVRNKEVPSASIVLDESRTFTPF